eukprot:13526493-Alexandrium_andersonii.AAC.1
MDPGRTSTADRDPARGGPAQPSDREASDGPRANERCRPRSSALGPRSALRPRQTRNEPPSCVPLAILAWAGASLRNY